MEFRRLFTTIGLRAAFALLAFSAAPLSAFAEDPAVQVPSVTSESPDFKPPVITTDEQKKVDDVIDATRKEPEKPPPAVAKSPAKKKPAKINTSKVVTKIKKPAKPVLVKVPTAQKVALAEKSTKPISGFELGKYQYCGEDRDCVPAVNGCCDCANGGEDVAVNRERLEAFRSRFECLNVSCSEKSREPVCGSGLVSCLNHKCKYFSERSLGDKF